MLSRIQQFLREEDGPTAVEYAVMLAMILMTAIVAIQSMGSAVNSSFPAALSIRSANSRAQMISCRTRSKVGRSPA